MKRTCPFFASMIYIVLVAAATASDTSAGLRFSLSGGPVLSLVVDQRLSPDVRVNFAVGGFPGVILRLEANLRIIPDKKKTIYYGGGFGYWRIYRGRGDGKSVKEFHGNIGYQFAAKDHLLFGGDVGLLYAPLSLNRWMTDLSDNPDMIPIVPVANIEALYHFK